MWQKGGVICRARTDTYSEIEIHWRSRPELNRHSRLERPLSLPLDDGNEWSTQRASNSRPDAGDVARCLLSYVCPGLATSQVVKERSALSGRFAAADGERIARRKFWCPTRDSNPDKRVSETRAYADSASGARKNPGTSRRNPGSGKEKARSAFAVRALGEVSAMALAFLRFRTRAVLAEFPAIYGEVIPARWQG